MKRILALALTLALCLSLCACGTTRTNTNDETDSKDNNTVVEDVVTPSPDPTPETPDVGDDVVVVPGGEDSAPENTSAPEPVEEKPPVVDESSKYNTVQEGVVTAVQTGSFTKDDVNSIKNMVLSDISSKMKTTSVQILDVTATDNINAIATALYSTTENDSTVYKLMKYDVRNHGDNGGWKVSKTYETGSFDTQYYDVSVQDGKLVATPKQEVSDQNYTSETIEAIKNSTGN